MPRLFHLGTRPPRLPLSLSGPVDPDWVQASPARIEKMLRRALALPTGGWYALGASRELRGPRPLRVTVDGRELVAWRGAHGEPLVAPARCPHMGADLACGHVRDGKLVCAWHGLALDRRHDGWAPLPAHDDGVLFWVRLPGEAATAAPVLCVRPARAVDAVVATDATCEPRDVVANRLDPWHGAHFHAHSFAALRMLEETEDAITLRVSYRALGPLCVEVDARFDCADARTVVMTIVGGEGTGSVVETHATPLDQGRTRILEATLATSDRPGFRAAFAAGALVRPFIAARARRLWVDDAAYAERTYQLRQQSHLAVAHDRRSRVVGDAE
jgi:isorenieratene synthase